MLRGLALTVAPAGQVTADAEWYFKAPCDLTLRAVSAGADNATTAAINVGTASDPDGFLDNVSMGQDDDPTLFDLDDFNGALVTDQGNDYPHISAGTVISVGLDVDASTDPIEPTITLWLQEG
jgi:hypothetical protein